MEESYVSLGNKAGVVCFFVGALIRDLYSFEKGVFETSETLRFNLK